MVLSNKQACQISNIISNKVNINKIKKYKKLYRCYNSLLAIEIIYLLNRRDKYIMNKPKVIVTINSMLVIQDNINLMVKIRSIK